MTMTRIRRPLLLLVLLLGGFAAPSAFAQSTAQTTFDVRITILSACTIGLPPATSMDFGLQSSSATNVDSTSTISVICTPGTPYNVGLNAGQNAGGGGITSRAMINGTNLVGYQLYSNPGRTTVWGNTIGTNTVAGVGNGFIQPLTVYGRVPSANSPTGLYLDLVTATITY